MDIKKTCCYLLVAVMVLSAFMLGGCAQAVVDSGKEVTIALTGGPNSFDPATTVDGYALGVEINLYNTLVYSKGGNSSEISPELATEWNVSEDNLVYTFKLRDDVKFHNGQKLTSADVKYTFERVMVEPYTAYYAEMIDKVEAPDDLTVVVTLKYPFGDFLTQLGGIYYGIVSQQVLQQGRDLFMYEPVGTGPYKLSGTYVPDQSFSFVVNEDYWGEKPEITKINYKTLPDSSTAVVALQNKEVDFVSTLSPNDYGVVGSDPNLKVYQDASFTIVYLTFYKLDGPFSEVGVRDAIAKAVNKDEIVSAANNGAGTVANSPLNKSMMGYDESIPANEFNIEAAKAALAGTSYKDGFETTIMVRSDRPYAVKTAQVVQAQLAEIGIVANIEQLEKATFNERLMKADFEMAIATLNWPDSNNMLTYLYDSQGAFNYDKEYSNPEVDALLQEAKTSTDAAKRSELYSKVVNITYADRPIIPLFFPNEIVGANANIQGIEIVDNMFYPVSTWTLSDAK